MSVLLTITCITVFVDVYFKNQGTIDPDIRVPTELYSVIRNKLHLSSPLTFQILGS